MNMHKKINTFAKFLLTVLILFCFSSLLKAQPEYFQRIYGASPTSDTYFNDITNAGNSGFLITGFASPGGLYLLMVNKYGAPVWDKKIYGCSGNSIVRKNDKYVIVGGSDSLYSLAVDSLGNQIWLRKFPLINYKLVDIIKTNDNGFAACGIHNYNFGAVVKFDSSGNLMWSKIYPQGYGIGFTKLLEYENNFYLISSKDDTITLRKPVLTKLNYNGEFVYEKEFAFSGLSFSFRDFIIRYNILTIFSDRFHIASFRSRNFIVKTDLNFNLLDTLTIPSTYPGLYNDILENITHYKNNHYIVQSYISDSSQNQFKLLDSNFHLLKFKNISTSSMLHCLFAASDNSILSVGVFDDEQFVPDYGYVNKMDSNFNTSSNVISIKENKLVAKDFSLSQNYPNPFNPSTKISYSLKKSSNIELKLFDISGRFVKLIESGYKTAGSYEINFTSEGLSSGVYFISLFSEGILADTKKAIIIK